MPEPTIEETIAEYLRLKQLMADVGEAQWQAGQSPVPREDTTERSKGLTSDPTPSIVVDARRLALRAAMIEAQNTTAKLAPALSAASHHLESALARWQG